MARIHQVTPHAQHKQTRVYVYGRRFLSSHASGAPRGRGACSEWSKPGKSSIAGTVASPGTGHRSRSRVVCQLICDGFTPPDLRRQLDLELDT